MVLRHNDKVLPEYLFAILKSNYMLAELQHLAETRSGTFPQITFSSELAPIKVRLPDKTTQKQIVSILSSIEQKISVNCDINNNLEQQAQALYKSWFVDFELNSGVMPSDWKFHSLALLQRFQQRYFHLQRIQMLKWSIIAFLHMTKNTTQYSKLLMVLRAISIV